MEKFVKKAFIYVMVLTLAFGCIGSCLAIPAKADEMDGDVIENPWSELFYDDEKNSDLDLGGNTTQNPSGKTDTTKMPTKKQITQFKKAMKTKVVSATKATKKAKKAKVILKKVKKATGYQVQYSLKKKFKNAKTKTSKKKKIIIKKLKARKKYYVRARAYGKMQGQEGYIYSAWSKKKVVKVKK